MLVLGLPSYHHSGWGLVRDGKILRAIQEERLNRLKHYPFYVDIKDHPMILGLEYLFRGTEYSVSDLDAVTIPVLPRDQEVARSQEHWVSTKNIEEALEAQDYFNRSSMGYREDRDYTSLLNLLKNEGFQGQVVWVNHHLSHAAYAYCTSGYSKADVLSYDGTGCGMPEEVIVGFRVDNHEYEVLFKEYIPNSMGHVYSHTTERIFGEKSAGCEGKTMGLAPYGKPIKIIDNPGMSVDLKFMLYDDERKKLRSTYQTSGKTPIPDNWREAQDQEEYEMMREHKTREHLGIEPYASILGFRQQNIKMRDQKKKWSFDEEDQFYADLAATVQKEIEIAGLHYVNLLKNSGEEENLCLTGGVALNSCLNGKIRREKIYKNVFAPPACHDGGHGLGAPLFYSNLIKKSKIKRQETDFLGYPYTDDECINAAKEKGLDFTQFTSYDEVGKDIAKEAKDQKIIAVFNQGSEFGPRALGHRSIVVDPRTSEMKDTLNARVKFRESYRPFAPFVLKEKSLEYFEFDESDFMLFVAKCTEKAKKEIPAVVHVDGTARMQTVDSSNEPFYSALKHFNDLTGTPVLLNTSFNVAGEPIVETPEDAIRCFMGTSIDVLYLNKIKIEK